MEPLIVQLPPKMDMSSAGPGEVFARPGLLRWTGMPCWPPPTEEEPPTPLVQAIFPTLGMW